MADTIDNINRKIIRKFNLLKDIAVSDTDIDILEKEYRFTVTHFLNEEINTDETREEFLYSLRSINVIERMNQLLEYIKTTTDKPDRDIKRMTIEFKNQTVNLDVFINPIDICDDCNCTSMYVDSIHGKAICNGCGKCLKINSADYEVDNTPIHNFKSHNTTFNKHSYHWLMRIQAKKSITLSQEVWDSIRNILYKNYTRLQRSFRGNTIKRLRNIKNVTCVEFRPWIKELNLTKLNPDIPYIRKVICGVYPYQLNHMEEMKILHLHSKAIEVYRSENEIDNSKKKNNPYIPYMLGKIIETLFEEDTKENRQRKTLLNCIFSQSNEINIERDKKWAIICNRLEIKYLPTISGSTY